MGSKFKDGGRIEAGAGATSLTSETYLECMRQYLAHRVPTCWPRRWIVHEDSYVREEADAVDECGRIINVASRRYAATERAHNDHLGVRLANKLHC